MDSSATYRTLRDANVFEERGDAVFLSDSFERALQERHDRPDEPTDVPAAFGQDAVAAYTDALEAFLDSDAVDPSGLLPTVLSVQYPPDRVAGTPDSFVPVRGEFVAPLVTAASASVVYVWQEDCDPCDVMRTRLGAAASDAPGVLCLGVFGPANARTLHDDFDVPGAPTTLFAAGGSAESRLLGQESVATIEREFALVSESA